MPPASSPRPRIIDPTKVVRTALQDAASVADLVITTEPAVASKPEPPAPTPVLFDAERLL